MDVIEKIDRRTKAGREMAKALKKPISPTEQAAIDAAARRKVVQPEPEVEVEVPLRRASRRDTREPSRDSTRQTTRGRVEVVGRNGEKLSRKRQTGIDPFFVDPTIIPKGWEYQWNAVSIMGNQEILVNQSLQMHENGWRPVPAERHPGRYMTEAHKGSIIREGLRLDERPKSLSDEARAEDLRAAHQLVSDRNEALQLTGLRKQMPSGFDMGGKYRGAGGDVRISIDQGADIPRPAHEVEE